MYKLLVASIIFFGLSTAAQADPIYTIEVQKNIHTLNLYKDSELIGQYDIIIGKPGFETPSFETNFNTISVNPTWHPTPRQIRHLRQHPDAIEYYGVKFTKDGIFSPPGPKNPLGKARLNLNYGPEIRIHGTSEPQLFDTERRNYSSGCIRVLHIQDLVEQFVGEQVDWNRAYTIKLSRPVHVIVH